MSNLFELVAENLVTTLETINITDDGFTPLVRRIGTSKRPTSKNVEPGDPASGPGALYTVEIEIQQPGISAMQPETFYKSYFWQNFKLVCFVEQSEKTEISTDTINNQIYTAIIKALMDDAQRSGLAQDTEVGDCAVGVSPDGTYEGIIVDVRVNVRSAQFDPTTA